MEKLVAVLELAHSNPDVGGLKKAEDNVGAAVHAHKAEAIRPVDILAKSASCVAGFAIVSTYTTFVFSLMAPSTSCAFVASTNETSIPSRIKVPKKLFVLPNKNDDEIT